MRANSCAVSYGMSDRCTQSFAINKLIVRNNTIKKMVCEGKSGNVQLPPRSNITDVSVLYEVKIGARWMDDVTLLNAQSCRVPIFWLADPRFAGGLHSWRHAARGLQRHAASLQRGGPDHVVVIDCRLERVGAERLLVERR
jgi:hypothetical protein